MTYQETQQEEIMQTEKKSIKYTLLKTFTAAHRKPVFSTAKACKTE